MQNFNMNKVICPRRFCMPVKSSVLICALSAVFRYFYLIPYSVSEKNWNSTKLQHYALRVQTDDLTELNKKLSQNSFEYRFDNVGKFYWKHVLKLRGY